MAYRDEVVRVEGMAQVGRTWSDATFSCKSRELSDQDFSERRLRLGGRADHFAKLGTVCDAAALGFIHVLADDDVAVLLGVVPECSKLGGDGEVHVVAPPDTLAYSATGMKSRRFFIGLYFLICLSILAGVQRFKRSPRTESSF